MLLVCCVVLWFSLWVSRQGVGAGDSVVNSVVLFRCFYRCFALSYLVFIWLLGLCVLIVAVWCI